MGNIFEFSDIAKSERVIKKTWDDFRNALSNKDFNYNDIESAKQYTFLKQYDDLFNSNKGIEFKTVKIKDIKNKSLGRGTILKEDEKPNYERFIPKREYISNDNRFSPKGVEWLYLAIGDETEIYKCSQMECRAELGNRFGFCHFCFDEKYDEAKLVNLTIADNISYSELNQKLETYGQNQVKKGILKAKLTGNLSKHPVDPVEFKKIFTEWGVFTYSKLLSEQIFEPITVDDDKKKIYTPFHTLAEYYISLGYSGIIYGSTVCDIGKNIVLFDKKIACPFGNIEDEIIKE